MKLARNFRESARNALRGRWGMAVIASVIASILGGTLFDTDFNLTYTEESEEITAAAPELLEYAIGMILFALPFILAMVFLSILLGSTVKVGHAKFYLDVIDGYPASIGSLFFYFRRWGTAVVAEILRVIIVTVGFAFFIVPGIIALHSLSMTPYILAENDSISAIDAMKESHRIMRGNRFRLFCLNLSFIGWILLSVLTFGIGLLWVNPYKNAACTDFYRSISDTYRIPYLHVDETSEDSGESSEGDWYYGE